MNDTSSPDPPSGELTWYKALSPDELPERRVKSVSCGDTTVAVTHYDGEYAALDNNCPHQGGPLGEGSIETGQLRCPWHGWDIDLVEDVQAFHFKAGQGAKTGTGGHLPGEKVQGRIAEVRDLEEGTDAVSPSQLPDLQTAEDFAEMADRVRDVGGGIPVGFKLSAQHVEDDIDFALEAGADYLILDGRGGGTGAAPDVFKNNISVPTMTALARARRHLDERGRSDVTLIATGGLRTESNFIKAMALGADGVAVANSAMQAIGCLGMRACDSNNCPVGVATQKEDFRNRLVVESAADGLRNFFEATVELMKVMARACGHDDLSGFERRDLTTWKKDIADLTGVEYAGVGGGG